jgi:HK97 family phage prohead protease
MKTIRQRFIPLEDCGLNVREASEGQGESRRVEGRPIVFGVRSRNLTPWSSYRDVYEVLEPGCLTNELLLRSDIVLNINHSTKVTDILGRCRNGKGTLDIGLRESYVEAGCDLPNTNCANDTLELIKRGDISGMSFAFEDDEEDSENGVSYEKVGVENGREIWIRHVKRITAIRDVAIVTNPAYEQTSVATREMGDNILKQIDALSEKTREVDEDPEDTKLREAQQAAEREYNHRKRLLQMKNL